MAEITLAKMGGTSHLTRTGAGRPAKSIREIDKPGIFNVNKTGCWILGMIGDDRTFPFPYDPVLRGLESKHRK